MLQYRVLGYIKDNTPSYLCIQVTDKKKNKLKLPENTTYFSFKFQKTCFDHMSF